MFAQTIGWDFCAETRQLVEGVATLSDLVEAEIYNFVADKSVAE